MPCRSAGNSCSRRLTASCLPDHAKSGNGSAVLRQTSRHGFDATSPFPLRFCRFIAVIRLIFTVFVIRLRASAALSMFSSSDCGHLLFSQCFRHPTAGICCFLIAFVSLCLFLLFLPFPHRLRCHFAFFTVSLPLSRCLPLLSGHFAAAILCSATDSSPDAFCISAASPCSSQLSRTQSSLLPRQKEAFPDRLRKRSAGGKPHFLRFYGTGTPRSMPPSLFQRSLIAQITDISASPAFRRSYTFRTRP